MNSNDASVSGSRLKDKDREGEREREIDEGPDGRTDGRTERSRRRKGNDDSRIPASRGRGGRRWTAPIYAKCGLQSGNINVGER